MYLRSLATAVPPNSFTQKSCWDAMRDSELLTGLKPRSASLLEKILTGGTSGIHSRNLARLRRRILRSLRAGAEPAL